MPRNIGVNRHPERFRDHLTNKNQKNKQMKIL